MPGRQNIIIYSLAVLLMLVSAPASADEQTHYDRIHLSVSAEQEVDNDTLIAALSAREEGDDQAALASAVNRTIKQAIERFKQRAENVTRQLSRKKYRLVKMNINTQGQTVRPTQMRNLAMMQEDKTVAPQIEPGKQILRVTVDATIELVVK